MCLPVSRSGYGALYIEHKTEIAPKKLPDSQAWWHRELAAAGNLVVISRSFAETRDALVGYLEG